VPLYRPAAADIASAQPQKTALEAKRH